MIRREDFDIKEGPAEEQSKITNVRLSDLSLGADWLLTLRKPDFQRVTDDWDSTRICGFIKSVLDGDFIPPVIFWRSPSGLIFVIDGAHRLASLIAWTHNDYGDKKLSLDYYRLEITDDQLAAAQRTRHLIEKTIGSYEQLRNILQGNTAENEKQLARARRLASAQIDAILITGESDKAEDSFIRINDSAAKINKTERQLISTRESAATITARAIYRAGTGHRYWSKFDSVKQKAIEDNAKRISDLLFKPPYAPPIVDTDLPLAGRQFSDQVLSLIRDFVVIANGLSNKETNKKSSENFDAAKSAEITLKYLNQCLHVVRIINWKEEGQSLGIHPTFYVYTQDGRHKPASFYALVAFTIHLEKENLFADFLKVRKLFEQAIEEYDYVIQQIVRYYRSAFKSYPAVVLFYIDLMSELLKNNNVNNSVKNVVDASGGILTLQAEKQKPKKPKRTFDAHTKSEVFLSRAKKNVLRCELCGGYLHKNAIVTDHIQQKRNKGMGDPANGQPVHPICTHLKN